MPPPSGSAPDVTSSMKKLVLMAGIPMVCSLIAGIPMVSYGLIAGIVRAPRGCKTFTVRVTCQRLHFIHFRFSTHLYYVLGRTSQNVMSVCVYIFVYVCVSLCTMYVCMHVCIYVCIILYVCM